MVPTNTGIFLRGLKLYGESRTQQAFLVSKKKIGGNHAFFRDKNASILNKTPYSSLYFTKEIKNAPSALLSYISTREFLRTREKCREARTVGECLSALLECSEKFPSAYITQQCTRNKFFISFIKYKQSQLVRQVRV